MKQKGRTSSTKIIIDNALMYKIKDDDKDVTRVTRAGSSSQLRSETLQDNLCIWKGSCSHNLLM